MLLEGLTLVVALWCAEHEVDNCPKVYQTDLSSHGVLIHGIMGRTPEGKRVIAIDDDLKGSDRWDVFYHEFGHLIEECEGRDGAAHSVNHKRSSHSAKIFTRQHRTGGWE